MIRAATLLAVLVATGTVHAQSTSCFQNTGQPYAACAASTTYPLVSRSFTATSGHSYTVTTSDLKNLAGHTNTFDTVVVVLNTDTETVVASDDDSGAGSASSLTFVASSGFNARVLMYGFNSLSYGTADLTVTDTTPTPDANLVSLNDVSFGGWNVVAEVKTGDRQFVGVPPDGQSHTNYVNSLYVFESTSRTCPYTTNCGKYVAGEGWASGLERLTMPWSDASSRILVGSGMTTPVGTRWFNARLGSGWGTPSCPTNSATADCDGDGLTVEIEGIGGAYPSILHVDTCDSGSGPSTDCNAGVNFSGRTGWTAKDTDNDGLNDAHEVFGVVRTCAQVPIAPYYYPGACTDSTFTTPGATWYALPLSALDPRPRDSDVFVHVAPQAKTGGNNYWQSATPPTWADGIDYIYEEEGLECLENTTSCGGTRYFVDVHLFQAPTVEALAYDTSIAAWPAADYFTADTSYTWQSRKFTGVFRYAQLLTNGNSAVTRGRYFTGYGDTVPGVTGLTAVARAYSTFAHELGHSNGLGHGGGSGELNYKLPYVSIMNYGYNGQPAKQASGDLWPDTFGAACAGGCAGAICDTGPNTCEVDISRAYSRFSRGTNPTVNETTIVDEDTVSAAWVTPLFTYSNGDGFSGTSFSPTCLSGAPCAADWNNDNATDPVDYSDGPIPPGPAYAASMNENSNVTDTSVADQNDWTLMYNRIKNSVQVVDGSNNAIQDNLYESRLRVFQSSLESTGADDVSAFDHFTTLDAGATVVTSFSTAAGNALNFSGQKLRVSSSSALETLGVASTNPSVGTNGWRIDMMVKFDTLTTVPGTFSGHQLVRSDILDAYTVNDSGSTYIQAYFDSPGTYVRSSVALAINTWYWVTLTWDNNDDLAVLYVVPRSGGAWNWAAAGACQTASYTYSGSTDPGDVTFAEDPFNSTWYLDGQLDELKIFNYPACVGFGVAGALPNDPIQQVSCGGGARSCTSN